MPLIVLVGIPSSGKTSLSQILKDFFEAHGHSVVLINEESLGVAKPLAYGSSREEKNVRAALKSAVERSLNVETIVILDSMNYIKGYRYELYCIARQVKTTYCVVYMDIGRNIAKQWNKEYTEELWDDLANRMEVPNQRNKWDSPMIIVREGENTPSDQVYQIVIKGRTLSENMATVKQPIVIQDYLHLADQTTQQVIDFILKAQEDYNEGSQVPVPETSVFYAYNKRLTALQLKKAKMQFLKINKTQPCSIEKAAEAFVEYINTSSA